MPQIAVAEIQPGMVVGWRDNPHLVTMAMQYTEQDGGKNRNLFLLDRNGEVKNINKSLIPTLPAELELLERRDESVWRSALLAKETNITQSYAVSGGSHYLTIGTDPEIFAVTSSGEVIPAFAYLGPKPENPERPDNQFFDGFQAEWTTNPSQCLEVQTGNCRGGMMAVLTAARKFDPKATLSHRSVVDITFDPALPPERYQLGCSPSMNAYEEQSVLVGTPEQLPFRSAGWHMHFAMMSSESVLVNGKWNNTTKNCTETFDKALASKIIRVLDRILGVSLVSFGEGYHDVRRRQMYGRAGEYRLGKTLEYRTPEVLMGCHPATWNLFWDLGRAVYWLAAKGFDFVWEADDDETREAINDSNVPLARKILERNQTVLKSLLLSTYRGNALATTFGLQAILTGVNSVVTDPTAIVRNWHILPSKESRNRITPPFYWRYATPILESGKKI